VEAIAHGLAEVIERDAAALNRIVRDCPAVNLDSIDDPNAAQEITRLQQAGLDVIVRWITRSDIQIPAFSVICTDRHVTDSLFVSGGYGAHPNRSVALVRALREAAASRVGTISGAREDLHKFSNRTAANTADVRARFPYWFDMDDAVDFATLPSLPGAELADDLATMVSAVTGANLPRILVADLTQAELKLQVVKVLVPGIERYSFRANCVGRRARTLYQAKYHRELPLPALHSDCVVNP
jgi:ribosomal protein S12 methylthiotransferase accessory factor